MMWIFAVVGYLLGSINTSIVVSRFLGTDIRQHGSGNAGATNALRTLGKKAAVWVLVGDIVKAVVAVLVTRAFTDGAVLPQLVAGFACILGHNFPVFFGFKGGKGILTSATVVFLIDWRVGLIVLGIFLVLVLATRYISLGSVASSFFLPLAAYVVGYREKQFIFFFIAVGFLAFYKHKENIKRLKAGTESKVSFKK